jgi:hypothetical protein
MLKGQKIEQPRTKRWNVCDKTRNKWKENFKKRLKHFRRGTEKNNGIVF